MKPPSLTKQDLLNQLNSHGLLTESISRAIEQAERSHGAQLRDNGNAYLTEHIYPVTLEIIRSYGNEHVPEAVIIGSLLHDAIEDDPNFSVEICRREFGENICSIVSCLTKTIDENNPSLSQEQKAKDNVKFLSRIANGPFEARLIKLSDRLNNLASSDTIRTLRPDKYQRYIAETEALFLPFAKQTSRYFYDRLVKTLETLKASAL